MAFALNSEKFLLKEGELYIGTFSSYDVSATSNPFTNDFTGTKIGYFKTGSLNYNMPRSFAEARSGTPSKPIRKDLIQKDFSLELEIYQWESDLLELLMGTDLVQNAGASLDNHFIGPDEPTATKYGFILKTELTDGKPVQIGIWKGGIYTEDSSITLAGTDYATLKVKIDALVANAVLADTKSFGYIQLDVS